MTFRCNMPKRMRNAALKKSLGITLMILAGWLGGTLFLLGQEEPTIRDVERQLDRHIAQANLDFNEKRLVRLEVATAANTEQLTLLKGGIGLMGGAIIFLNVLGMIGFRINLVRKKDNGSD